MSSRKTNKTPTQIGIVLTNTGSPDAPTSMALKLFLREFLSDPRVVNYPRWVWLPILHGIILNVRPQRSARLYQKIWKPSGSPLLDISQAQARSLQKYLSTKISNPIDVISGMRYGRPSINESLNALLQRGSNHILIFPLYPQYSCATSESIFDAVKLAVDGQANPIKLRVIPHYHNHPAYIQALANSVRDHWANKGKAERLLISFHGIPQSYIRAGDPYGEQCSTTSSLLAEALGLESNEWYVAFQSRFGPQAWLQPYTNSTLINWGRAGAKQVDVICPGFSADCLETLYEIQHEGRDLFINSGGEALRYIPALNDQSDHILALGEIILDYIHNWKSVTDSRVPLASQQEIPES
jgi:ferrochelatase